MWTRRCHRHRLLSRTTDLSPSPQWPERCQRPGLIPCSSLPSGLNLQLAVKKNPISNFRRSVRSPWAFFRVCLVGLIFGLPSTTRPVWGETPGLSIRWESNTLVLRSLPKSERGIATIFQTEDLAVPPKEWTPWRTFPASRSVGGPILLPNYGHSSGRFFRIETSAISIPDEMVWILPGSFVMGSPESEAGRNNDEGPARAVVVTEGFWLSKYEVSQAEFEALMEENPSRASGDPNRPVEMVSWYSAVQYCAILTEREQLAGRLPPGYAYRLPTEAEWEYACRAGSKTSYSFGEDQSELSAYAWWADNGGPAPHPVGRKRPNLWGLYDMHGNVFEWCLDKYQAYPGGRIVSGGERRVLRSGAFYCPWFILRSACRLESARPSSVSNLVGFRVALAPVQPLLDTQAETSSDTDLP